MNLIEAVKSGKLYRREAHAEDGVWLYPNKVYTYEKDDIVADDWEIQEPFVLITRTKFWEAHAAAMKDAEEHRMAVTSNPSIHCYENGYTPIQCLAKRLGLEAQI